MHRRFFGGVLAVLVVEIYELVTVQSVERQDDHYQEIGNQQRRIEGIPSVEVLKSTVAVMRAEIMRKAVLIRLRQKCRRGGEDEFQREDRQQGLASTYLKR